MFYATIVFAVVYLVRFEVLDGDNQVVEYNKAVAEAKAEIKKIQVYSYRFNHCRKRNFINRR